MNSRNDRKIKNLFINKNLQSKIIITGMLYMFLVLIITIGTILFPIIHEMLRSDDLNTQYKAAQSFLILAKRLLPCTIVLFSFFFVHLILITHRICGPLVNFTNTFNHVARGDLTRKVKLRKRDYLHRECNEINAMIEGLSKHILTAKKNHDKMSEVLEEALESVEDINTRKRIEIVLDEVKGEALIVSKDLSTFKLDETDK